VSRKGSTAKTVSITEPQSRYLLTLAERVSVKDFDAGLDPGDGHQRQAPREGLHLPGGVPVESLSPRIIALTVDLVGLVLFVSSGNVCR
jgi:hypothetical protein